MLPLEVGSGMAPASSPPSSAPSDPPSPGTPQPYKKKAGMLAINNAYDEGGLGRKQEDGDSRQLPSFCPHSALISAHMEPDIPALTPPPLSSLCPRVDCVKVYKGEIKFASGSGVIFTPEGHLITNSLLVRNALELKVIIKRLG